MIVCFPRSHFAWFDTIGNKGREKRWKLAVIASFRGQYDQKNVRQLMLPLLKKNIALSFLIPLLVISVLPLHFIHTIIAEFMVNLVYRLHFHVIYVSRDSFQIVFIMLQ